MRFSRFLLLTICVALFAVGSPHESAAQPAPQVYTKTADTSVDADTVYVNFNQLSSNVTSLTASVTRLTDATEGTIYLEGRNLSNGSWHKLDSLVTADVAYQEKVFPITSMSYYDYRLNWPGEGTGTRILKFTYVRRPDDR